MMMVRREGVWAVLAHQLDVIQRPFKIKQPLAGLRNKMWNSIQRQTWQCEHSWAMRCQQTSIIHAAKPRFQHAGCSFLMLISNNKMFLSQPFLASSA